MRAGEFHQPKAKSLVYVDDEKRELGEMVEQKKEYLDDRLSEQDLKRVKMDEKSDDEKE